MAGKHDPNELRICAKTQHEGFGSVYERVMLNRLLSRLLAKFPVASVLEYQTPFVKGFDNLVFLENGCKVTVCDEQAEQFEAEWPFGEPRPRYTTRLEQEEKFDLVWNFAAFQLGTFELADMMAHTRKYVLIFTPNILNYGTPFHIAYHVLSFRKCMHAEQGSVGRRHRSGLARVARRNGLKVIESGYVDVPWWPDTAFSIREFKRYVLRMKSVNAMREAGSVKVRDAGDVLDAINGAGFMENNRLLRPFFAHHCYVFAEKVSG